jgi:hypothetical protein
MAMKKISNRIIFILLGALFGFLLSRAGATTYDFYAGLFLFQDLQLLWVIAAAAGVGAMGVIILKKLHARSVIDQKPLSFQGKPYKKSLIPGSLLFGMGWGLAGACPGTALVMLGEGKMGALITILGIIAGTFFYGLQMSRAAKTTQSGNNDQRKAA